MSGFSRKVEPRWLTLLTIMLHLFLRHCTAQFFLGMSENPPPTIPRKPAGSYRGRGTLLESVSQTCHVFGSEGLCLPKAMCKPPMGYTDTIANLCKIPKTFCCYDALKAYVPLPVEEAQEEGRGRSLRLQPKGLTVPFAPGSPPRLCMPQPGAQGECLSAVHCTMPRVSIDVPAQCGDKPCCFLPPPKSVHLCYPMGYDEDSGICVQESECKAPRTAVKGFCPFDTFDHFCCFLASVSSSPSPMSRSSSPSVSLSPSPFPPSSVFPSSLAASFPLFFGLPPPSLYATPSNTNAPQVHAASSRGLAASTTPHGSDSWSPVTDVQGTDVFSAATPASRGPLPATRTRPSSFSDSPSSFFQPPLMSVPPPTLLAPVDDRTALRTSAYIRTETETRNGGLIGSSNRVASSSIQTTQTNRHREGDTKDKLWRSSSGAVYRANALTLSPFVRSTGQVQVGQSRATGVCEWLGQPPESCPRVMQSPVLFVVMTALLVASSFLILSRCICLTGSAQADRLDRNVDWEGQGNRNVGVVQMTAVEAWSSAANDLGMDAGMTDYVLLE